MQVLIQHFAASAGVRNPIEDVRGIHLHWRLLGYSFKAKFYASEPLMRVGLYLNEVEIDDIEVPYSPQANISRLHQDLKLARVSEVLVHQAALAGKIGVQIA